MPINVPGFAGTVEELADYLITVAGQLRKGNYEIDPLSTEITIPDIIEE